MEKLILHIKDKSKLEFLIELIAQLDFVVIEKTKTKRRNKDRSFLDSAGLWTGREISAKELRNKAWQRKK